MGFEKEKAAFERDGALLLENFFTADELSRIGQSVLGHYLKTPPRQLEENFKQFETFSDPWSPDKAGEEPYQRLRDHPKLRALTTALLGEDYAEEISLMMRTRPGTGQAWHQDTRSDDPAKFILNRIVYPLPAAPGSGGLYCVPGSHRQGRIPRGPAQEELPGQLRLRPKPGTLVILHSFCFHRVTLNDSAEPRYSVNLRCRPSSCPSNFDSIGVYRPSAYDFHALQPFPY